MQELNVLVLDDEENILWVLKEGLSDDKLKVHMASKIEEAEFILEKHPISACIVDLFINNINAINYVKKWSALYPYIHFLIITAQDTSTNIIESIKAGAADIFPKPFDIKEIKGKILDLICTDKGRINSVEDVIKYDFQSKNKKMVDIYKLIGRIAKSDISILIEGDTGTGKEVIARMIHDKSDRKESPFIAINMAAVPKELLESELFGYEKGAFTGASSLKIGRFEEADGGTILLDEISELDYSLQSKLLRVIQDKEITRIGSNKIINLNVRILAATNKNLDILVEKNLFRQDLFYRLNVITVKLPKLKERKEDIGLLAQYFLKKYSYMKDREIIIGDEVVTKLKIYNWPGNIRELENTILYAIINSDSNVINVNNLPAKIFEAEKKQGKGNSLHKELYNLAMQYFEETPLTLDSFIPYDEYIKMVEVPLIEAALSFCSGNKSKAAEILGINRNTLRKKIEEYGVK